VALVAVFLKEGQDLPVIVLPLELGEKEHERDHGARANLSRPIAESTPGFPQPFGGAGAIVICPACRLMIRM
jgi:hypothetical protein